MTPALGALPELLRRPGVVWTGVSEFHLRAAPLAAYLNLDVVHAQILVSVHRDSQQVSDRGVHS